MTTPHIRFVSAIYNIQDTRRRVDSYHTFLWEQAIQLSDLLPGGLHICCSPDDPQISSVPQSIQCYPFTLPYGLTGELPPVRNIAKDTANYLTLQNTKPQFLQHVKERSPADVKTFIWIDAGITKILTSPTRLQLLTNDAVYPTDRIRIPGPGWNCIGDANRLTQGIWWRFCGGIVIVPTDFVEPFAQECVWGQHSLYEQTGRITWEVNVWTYLEACHRIPFELVSGDHNDTILDALFA